MNKFGNDIIVLYSQYLCSTYYNKILTIVYFSRIIFDLEFFLNNITVDFVNKYKFSINIKNVHRLCDILLIPLVISHNIKYIRFNNRFNNLINRHIFPPTVETLIFGDEFNMPINNIYLPLKLKNLTFGKNFCQLIRKNTLPLLLEELIFSNSFNYPIFHLPITLKKLTFGFFYNHNIDGQLPPSLEELTFDVSFNQPIKENSLPISLRKLKFGYSFDQNISDSLLKLSQLETLIFVKMNNYNQIEIVQNLLCNGYLTNLQYFEVENIVLINLKN
jgi:hypothetical protein